MIRPNIEPPKRVSYFQLQILDELFPLVGGNICVVTELGGRYAFAQSDMERMTFGDRVAQLFTGDQFTIPKTLPSGGIITSKALFERLRLHEHLLKFASKGHGELTYWNIENDISASNIEQGEYPLFEAKFTHLNPYALVAMTVSAVKDNFAIYHLPKCGIKTVEAIPEIAAYIRQNEQSHSRQ